MLNRKDTQFVSSDKFKNEIIIVSPLNLDKRIVQARFQSNINDSNLNLLTLTKDGTIVMYRLYLEMFEKLWEISAPSGIITDIGIQKNGSDQVLAFQTNLKQVYTLKIVSLNKPDVVENTCSCLKDERKPIIIVNSVKPLEAEAYPILEPVWDIKSPKEAYLSYFLAWVMVVDKDGIMYYW